MTRTQGAVDLAGRVALIAVLVLLAMLAVRQIGTPDIGFHLRAGNWILDGNGWPDRDPFTYTVNDRPYVDTSWGYQVGIALVHRVAGAPGLVLAHLLLVLATFGGLAWMQLRDGHPTSRVALVLLVACLASEPRFDIRPELLSWTFLTVLLWLLSRHGRGGPWLTGLPLLFLVWANCHSLFIVGWATLGCFVVGETLRRRAVPWSLAGWSGAALVASLLNPYGLTAPRFALSLGSRMRGDNVFAQTITEFQSPLAQLAEGHLRFYPWALGCFVLWLVWTLVALPDAWRRRDISRLLLILAFLPLALNMTRNTPLLVLVAFGPVTELLRRWRPFPAGRPRLALATALLALALAAQVITDAYYIDGRRTDRWGLGWNGLELPVAAVAWSRTVEVTGPVLNHLNFGAYLMWARPEPVFIDGRLEVMGEAFFEAYRHALASPAGLEAAVARWGIRWILFPYDLRPDVLDGLSRDPRWRLAYVDHLAAVFLRNGPGVESRIDASALAAESAGTTYPSLADLPGLGSRRAASRWRVWLEGFVIRQRYPDRPFALGLFHYHRREAAPAAAQFAEAIRRSGGRYPEAYRNLGAALMAGRQWDDATAAYEAYLARLPFHRGASREHARLKLEEIAELRGAP